jgi:hypothetical protein
MYIYTNLQNNKDMATIKSDSPLSGASGRLGNVVTYTMNGVQVIRSLPFTKKRKATKLQRAHLESFKMQHLIAKSLKVPIIQRIWNRFSYEGGMNGYNRFIQINRPAYGASGEIEFPELFVISQGTLIPARDLTVTHQDHHLQFAWTPGDRSPNCSGTDRLNIALLSNRSSIRIIETGIFREAGQASIELPANMVGMVEGYVFWSSLQDRNFSPSIYWVCK